MPAWNWNRACSSGTGLNICEPYRPPKRASCDKVPSVFPELGVDYPNSEKTLRILSQDSQAGMEVLSVGEEKLTSPGPTSDPAATAVLVIDHSAWVGANTSDANVSQGFTGTVDLCHK